MMAFSTQFAAILTITMLAAIPLGYYCYHVLQGKRTFLSPLAEPCTRLIYRLTGVDANREMTWQQYTAAVAMFSLVSFALLFIMLCLQGYLGFNPQQAPGMSWDLAFNTAASFVTNTNWQAYSGETQVSYLTQSLGLTVQNFVSAATGIAVLFAFIRGFKRRQTVLIGNFWVDITRIIIYILLPLNILLSLALVSGGVIQNFNPAASSQLLESVAVMPDGRIITDAAINPLTGTVSVAGKDIPEATLVTEQFVPMGPAASQIAIKQTGTNGGGYTSANSANPLENPTPYTNFLEAIAILLLPMALCFSFGAASSRRQGLAILAAMLILLTISASLITLSEQHFSLQQYLADSTTTHIFSAAGNLEGKETRFGITASSIWTAFTTSAANGSSNSSLASYTPLSIMAAMMTMQTGEIIFGGAGSGLYSMLAFIILTVFIAGLMVGRTPEFLGKKIEPREMKWAAAICLVPAVTILTASACAAMLPATVHSFTDSSSAHAFSKLLYAYTSAGANNGSSMGGFDSGQIVYNISLGLCMLAGRFIPIIGALAISGSLTAKNTRAITAGTLPTDNALFTGLLIAVIIIVGALSFFPALALGPIAEMLNSI